MNLLQMVEALTSPPLKNFDPCVGTDPYCPCQDGDACHYKDSKDGTAAMPVPENTKWIDGNVLQHVTSVVTEIGCRDGTKITTVVRRPK